MENAAHIGDRIKKVIIDKGMTAASLAKTLGVSQAGLSGILNGRNNPDFNFIAKFIKNFANVNRDWLILGVGEAYVYNYSGVVNESESEYFSHSSKSNTHSGLFFQADSAIQNLLIEIHELKLRLTKLESA